MQPVNHVRIVPPTNVVDRKKMDLHHRCVLINELHFLHQRLATLIAAIATREKPGAMRDALFAQHLTDRHIAARLSAAVNRLGMAPRPSANLAIIASLEELRFADRNRSASEGRLRALCNAMRSVRLHAIHLWSELLDAIAEDHHAELRDEVLALQTVEAELFRSLYALDIAPLH